MKKCIFIKLAVLLVVVLFFSACRDPIFHSIAQEVAPIEPRIRGGPTNMVIWQELLLVASGSRLHWYRQQEWDSREILPDNYQHLYEQLRHPGGRVTMLAATENHLYALILHGNDTTQVRRFNPGAGSWDSMIMEPARQGLIIQTIFAPNPDSNNLFIGIGNTGASDILILRGDSTQIELLREGAGMLVGAAYYSGNYFLPIRATVNEVNVTTNYGNTIVRYNGAGNTTVMTATGDVFRGFAGIINIGDSVVAIDRGGDLFNVTVAGVQRRYPRVTMDGYATGVLALWQRRDDSSARLLLAGRQGSLFYTFGGTGFTFGYVELAIPITANSFHEPGDNIPPAASTVYNNARYRATIGQRGINHIFQAPYHVCSEMRLFASTQGNGLWSYRDHFGNREYHWNAEY